MAKESGLGDRLYVGGYDLSGDINSLSTIHGGPALWDVTDITQSAHARAGILRDGGLEMAEFFDTALAHPVLSALPVADEVVTYLQGTAIGGPAACLNAKQIGYDPTRGADGSLMLKTEAQANGYGLEWGVQLTAGTRTDTGATSGTDVDGGAPSDFGAQAYLQALALTGTDVTVEIEHSADNSTWASLMSFAEVHSGNAAPLAQRISVVNTTTVDRYVRVITTTSAGFTSFAFQVAFVRNSVAGIVF